MKKFFQALKCWLFGHDWVLTYDTSYQAWGCAKFLKIDRVGVRTYVCKLCTAHRREKYHRPKVE